MMDLRLEQPRNASFPMVFTDSGIVIEVRDEQPKKV